MKRELWVLLFLYVCVGACTVGLIPKSEIERSPLQHATIRFVNRLSPSYTLQTIRFAVDYEIQYINVQLDRHPLPDVIAQLDNSTKRRRLFIELQLRSSNTMKREPMISLQQTYLVTIQKIPAQIVISVGPRPKLGIEVQHAVVYMPNKKTKPLLCKELNPDLSSCQEKRHPLAEALCRIRMLQNRAKQRMNPGWLGCVNHRLNLLRIARQRHLHHAKGEGPQTAYHKKLLFDAARHLAAEAEQCVMQYYLCNNGG